MSDSYIRNSKKKGPDSYIRFGLRNGKKKFDSEKKIDVPD